MSLLLLLLACRFDTPTTIGAPTQVPDGLELIDLKMRPSKLPWRVVEADIHLTRLPDTVRWIILGRESAALPAEHDGVLLVELRQDEHGLRYLSIHGESGFAAISATYPEQRIMGWRFRLRDGQASVCMGLASTLDFHTQLGTQSADALLSTALHPVGADGAAVLATWTAPPGTTRSFDVLQTRCAPIGAVGE